MIRTKKWKLFGISALAALIALIGLIFYGRWEASRLECNQIALTEEILPGLQGLRILVISDIHNDDEQLDKAINEGLRQKPDIAVILGDIIHGDQRTSRTRKLIEPLKKLADIVPTYACLGNHDMEKLSLVSRILSSSGIRLLRNESVTLDIPRLGEKVILAGLGEWWECDSFPERCLERTNEVTKDLTPVIVLSHTPSGRNEAKDFRWNLMLSGHTHGGQLRYPITNQAVFHREGELLTEGLHEVFPGKSIFITRGIGSALSLRFNCPPEFNILVVP